MNSELAIEAAQHTYFFKADLDKVICSDKLAAKRKNYAYGQADLVDMSILIICTPSEIAAGGAGAKD